MTPLAAAFCSSVMSAIAFSVRTILASSSLDIPIALAIAVCWMRFILANSAADAPCLDNSFATPSRSLFNANSLALFKLIFLPVSS